MRPRLALVPGEPAGVGPELCVLVLGRAHDADITVFGDRDVLVQAADAICLPPSGFCYSSDVTPVHIRIVEVPNPAETTFCSQASRNVPAANSACDTPAAI